MRKIVPSLLLLAFSGCKSSDISAPPPGVVHGSGSSEGAIGPGSGSAGTGSSIASKLGQQIDGAQILDAKYDVSVAVAGIPVCKGTASLLINVPAAPKPGVVAKPPLDVKCIALSCAFGKQVNIDSLLGGLAKPAGPAAQAGSGGSGLAIDDKYMRIKGLDPGTFTPGLVLLPNFSGGAPAFLKAMNEAQTVQLVDQGASVNASGSQKMKTLAFDSAWDGHKMTGVKFSRIFQFQIDTDGFAGTDRLKYLLFTGLGARINLAPLSLVSLDLTTKVADLLAIFKNAGGAPPPSSGECGTPPPAPQGNSVLDGLLNGAGAGSGSASGSGPSAIGAIAGLLSKVVNVDFNAVLVDQKGLKEAIAKQNEVDQLINSQTSGGGS